MTRKSKPRSACPLCKHHKYLGNARDRERFTVQRATQPEEHEDCVVEGKRAPAKKDTRRWCKGKVGREHSKRCHIRQWLGRDIYRLECTNCGKIFEEWYPGSFFPQPKPEWVVLRPRSSVERATGS